MLFYYGYVPLHIGKWKAAAKETVLRRNWCVCVHVVSVCMRMCALVCTSILPERKKIIEAEVGVMVAEVPTQAVYLYSQSTSSSQPCPQGISIFKTGSVPNCERMIPLFSWCK